MKHLVSGLAALVCLSPAVAAASPLFELAGGVDGTSSFTARAAGASPASTYFNPALLPYADRSFNLGVLVLSEQISIHLDGRRTELVPTDVRTDGVIDSRTGAPISKSTIPTDWLERGCKACGNGFPARPRQGAGSSGVTRAYQIIGLTTPLLGKRLVLGFHALVPLGKFTTAYSFYNDEREQYFSNSLHPELYGDRMTATSLAFGAGSELAQGLSVGFSFTLSLTNVAGARTYVLDPADYDSLSLSNDVAVEANVSPHFGISYAPLDALRLSATVHTVQKFEIDVGFGATLTDGNESSTHRTNVHDYVPLQATLGAELITSKRLSVAATATYGRWSSYLDRQGDSPSYYGGEYKWRDTVSPSLGVVVRPTDLLRTHAHVTYVPSPVPPQTGRSNFVDSDRMGVTLGGDYQVEVLGLKLRPGLQLMSQRLFRRAEKKRASELVDEFVDTAANPADCQDRNNPTVDTCQHLARAQGLQTNNPGYPGFASDGWITGGSVYIDLIY